MRSVYAVADLALVQYPASGDGSNLAGLKQFLKIWRTVLDGIPVDDVPQETTMFEMFSDRLQHCQEIRAEWTRIQMAPEVLVDGSPNPERTYDSLMGLCNRVIELKELR